jgi:hypothetical protein
MQAEPARCNRALDTDAVLIRRATGLEKCAVDRLDVYAAVPCRLGCVRDLHQLARGSVGISEGAGFDESRGHDEQRSDEGRGLSE